MTARRKPGRGGGGGGHGGQPWVISFADLMSLLMAFFVMLLSFSIQDQEKLKQAAGSVRDAFGIVPYADVSGMIERNGNPQRDYLRNVAGETSKDGSEFASVDRSQNDKQGQEANTWTREKTDAERQQGYSLAAASLQQAWKDLPDITSISDHIQVQETEQGLDIEITDRDGQAMFPAGSKYPYELTRKALVAMAPALAQLPNRIRISGYTAAGATYDNPRYGAWELSFDRADVARQILEEYGLGKDRIESVVGRADTDPFFPNDPYLAANQRISILLVNEKPPVPVDLKP